MPEPQIAPYGSWSSPITSDLIVASSIGLGEILVDGGDVYWLESRPQEGGRSVLVRRAADGTLADVTPPAQAGGQPAFNVRTRVHEYGGGAYLVSAGTVYFCNDADQRVYCQKPGAEPVAITPDPVRPRGLRYADGVMDAERGRMIWVREDHTTGAPQPVNTLVDIPLDRSGSQRILQSGRDFYAAPRLSPDGRRLAWLEWDHPNMPWIGCDLWVAELAEDGSLNSKQRVAGGDDESIFQPEWSPDGTLYFVSDRAQDGLDGRWWNLFRARHDKIEPVCPLAAEFGRPQWNFRMSTFAFDSAGRLVCCHVQNGVHRLSTIDPASLEARPIATPYQDISSVRAGGGRIYFRGGSPTSPPAIVELDLAANRTAILKRSTAQDIEAYRGFLSVPEPVTFDNRQRPGGLRPVLPAAKLRFLGARGAVAAADRALPRRPDRQLPRRRSAGARSIGPAAALPSSMSITAAAPAMAASSACGCKAIGGLSMLPIASMARAISPRRGGSSIRSGGRSAAAAPAATPRSRC